MIRPIILATLSMIAQSAVAAPVVSTASANISFGNAPLMGVNLSGCEFINNGALCPTVASLNEYIDKGFNAFRIPFRGAQAADPAVVKKLVAVATAAAARGAYVILDRHDYGTTFDAAQAAWWVSFAKNFPDTKYVMIDTMNEPSSGASYQPDAKTKKSYASEVNAGIAAFRAAGMKHKLLIEWRGSSGMSRFDKGEAVTKACESPACSFDRSGGLKDPLGLTMVSGHRYFDLDGSGTSGACDKRMPLLRMFISNTDYNVQIRGLKVWVGEMAFGSAKRLDPWCKTVGGAIIERMKSMPDVYAGVTWWGGGAGWKEDYLFKIEPTKGTFKTAARNDYLTMISGR
jgi:endoglucanase